MNLHICFDLEADRYILGKIDVERKFSEVSCIVVLFPKLVLTFAKCVIKMNVRTYNVNLRTYNGVESDRRILRRINTE